MADSTTPGSLPVRGKATVETDVVIVGAGPAGASLACFLSSYGIKGVIVDINPTSADTPRAHITNMAALEALRDLGLDAVLARLATKNDNMVHTRWAHSMAGREYGRIYAWGHDPKRMGEYISASPCRHCDLPQTLLEPELVRYATLHGFQIRWTTEYQSFTEDSDGGVVVTVLDKLTQQTYTISGKYLFGCDGARSRIVKQLELPMQSIPGGGLAFNVLVRADMSHLIKPRMGNLHWIVQPDQETPDFGWLTVVRMVKPWWEWMFIFIVKPGGEERKPEKEEALRHCKKIIGDNTEAEVLRIDPWRINETVAEVYSKGRVFCLGDAVHRHPPTNGLGSNTCIQDAFNLAWKVAYVMQNKAGPNLLKTYHDERQPVGKALVKRANDSFRAQMPVLESLGAFKPTISARVSELQELGANTPSGRARRTQLQAAIADTAHEYHALGADMNQLYASTAVVTDPADDVAEPHNPDPDLYHFPSTRPGRRLPHVWVTRAVPDGLVSTVDLAGKGGFTVFTGVGGEGWKEAARKVGEKLGVPVRAYSIGWGCDFEDVYFDWARLRGVEEDGCVLVRPDRFVAWRYKEIKSEDRWAEKELERVLTGVLAR